MTSACDKITVWPVRYQPLKAYALFGLDWKCRTGKWGTNEGPITSKTNRHDWKTRDQISRVEKCNARPKNAELENRGPKMQGWKMQDRKMRDQFHLHWKKKQKICCASFYDI